jgi:hypothetical protein
LRIDGLATTTVAGEIAIKIASRLVIRFFFDALDAMFARVAKSREFPAHDEPDPAPVMMSPKRWRGRLEGKDTILLDGILQPGLGSRLGHDIDVRFENAL